MTTTYTARAILVLICLLSFAACEKGNGVIITQTFELDNFDKVNLIRHADVYITQGSPQSVTIEGEENLMDNIKTEVVNGQWTFEFKKTVTEYKRMTIHLTLPAIHGIMATEGSGSNIYTQQPITTDTLIVSMRGDGEINAEIAVSSVLTVSSVGSGSVSLAGTTDRYVASNSGAGAINSYNLIADHGSIETSGLGDAQVHFMGPWSATVAGSGSIRYKGMAPNDTVITGTGTVVMVP